MMKAEPIGLYVHIPFCIRKCNYCDFCSVCSESESGRTDYLTALKREIESYKRESEIAVDTVFFGGGTPSILSVNEFSLLCDAITDTFCLLPNTEFTVEANPKTLTKEKLFAYKKHGVNRISLGMQSIHEKELKKLGRIHSHNDFLEAYKMVYECGISNVNVDLMYGIPYQTLDTLKETCSLLISLSPEHISAYGLIIEEGTPFFKERNSLPLPSEDEECEMYDYISKALSSVGYSHYEISNYAKPERQSKHNLKYWKNKEYIGVGVSAHSYFEGRRFSNPDVLKDYCDFKFCNFKDFEKLSESDRAFEYVMLRLRLSEGISLSEYKKEFGYDFITGREKKLREYQKLSLVKLDNDRLSLTEKGFYLSNTILSELL